ncbi:hypothetical protein [Arthrobacter sp. IK3]|uniref:hypothetical protein n=1 Tax=Arthrobacter sp. IK3 TaxID=3448169 RepID=UPI003EDF1256
MREPIVPHDNTLADMLNALFLRRAWRQPATAAPEQSPWSGNRDVYAELRQETATDPAETGLEGATPKQAPDAGGRPADAGPSGTCEECGNDASGRYCDICNDRSRDLQTIMVVRTPENIRDTERTGQFRGIYQVLPPLGDAGQRQAFSEGISRLRGRAERYGAEKVFLALSGEDPQEEVALRESLQLDELVVVQPPFADWRLNMESIFRAVAEHTLDLSRHGWVNLPGVPKEAAQEQRTGPDDDPPGGGWKTAK